MLIVVATAAVIAPMTVTASWTWHVSAAIMLAVLTVAAVAMRGPAPLRTMVYLDVAFLLFALGTHLRWPPAVTTVLVCVLPLAALLVGHRAARSRLGAPWLRAGLRPDRLVLVLAAGTIVAAGTALVLWTLATHPAAPPYLAELQRYPSWLAILGVIGFALVNPIWEEALFRGVVLEDLIAVWGAIPAVIGQAVLFGAAHWSGFPSGWIGVLMAAAWGLMLGILRLRTHGIAVPYLVHVTANAVIGSLAVLLL